MSALGNNQLAIERGEKNEVSQIKCQNKKLSKSKPEINPGSKLRVLAVTGGLQKLRYFLQIGSSF